MTTEQAVALNQTFSKCKIYIVIHPSGLTCHCYLAYLRAQIDEVLFCGGLVESLHHTNVELLEIEWIYECS